MAVFDTYVTGLDLMVLETPLLRVSRPVAACSRCRGAKIKCDGKLPVIASNSALQVFVLLILLSSRALLAIELEGPRNAQVRMTNLPGVKSVAMSLPLRPGWRNWSARSGKLSNGSPLL